MSHALVPNFMNPSRLKVNIGGLSAFDLLERMEAIGIKLNSLALEMLKDEHFRTEESVSTVEVVPLSVRELGLPHGGTLAQAIDAAESLGYQLCPRELGPHLRLAYTDQGEGSIGFDATQHQAPPGSITVVDQRPNEHESEYRGFYLRRIEGTLWLRGYKSWSGHVWQPQDMLVFTTARNAAPSLKRRANSRPRCRALPFSLPRGRLLPPA